MVVPSQVYGRGARFSSVFQTHCRCLYSIGQQSSSLQQLRAILQKNLVQRNNSLHNYGLGTMRCMMFDSDGKLKGFTTTDFKREDLIHKHGLLARDLRKIEKARRNDLVPIILVRDTYMMLSLLNIRALIKHNMVLLFDAAGINLESKMHIDFIKNLKTRLRNHSVLEVNKDPLPYEFRALESIFIHAISDLTSELRVHTSVTKGILTDLEYSITSDKLKFLLIQNKKMSIFHKKSLLIREMVNELLEQDDELSQMYLTEKYSGSFRAVCDHSEIEMLLETYYTQIDEIVHFAEIWISNMRTTAEIINIILDSNRNQLMLLGLRFSVGLLSLGCCLFVATLYGMNLENFIQETSYGFPVATIVGILSMVMLLACILRHVNKLQKITLSGGGKRK